MDTFTRPGNKHSPTVKLETHQRPQIETTRRACQQVIYDTAGERSMWVTYDPTAIAAVVHLTTPTRSSRYMLGAAGYARHLFTDLGELWARETNN